MDNADTQKHCSSGSVHFEMETLAARCCSDAKSMCWVAPALSPTHVVKMALTLPVPLATFDSQHRPSLQRAIARVVRVSIADVLIVIVSFNSVLIEYLVPIGKKLGQSLQFFSPQRFDSRRVALRLL